MPLLPASLPATHVSRALEIPFDIGQCGQHATSVPPVIVPPLVVPAPVVPALHEAMDRRRAVRAFSAQPVPASTVEQVLAAGQAAYRAHFSVCLRVLVAGLDGTQAWLPDLRAAYAPAPIFLLVCGDVASGPAAWASALSHAGALGHALWLSGVHLGLAGCAFGGSRATATAAVQRSDPALRHLFTIALGYSQESGHRLEDAPVQ
jgi:nitroreductase